MSERIYQQIPSLMFPTEVRQRSESGALKLWKYNLLIKWNIHFYFTSCKYFIPNVKSVDEANWTSLRVALPCNDIVSRRWWSLTGWLVIQQFELFIQLYPPCHPLTFQLSERRGYIVSNKEFQGFVNERLLHFKHIGILVYSFIQKGVLAGFSTGALRPQREMVAWTHVLCIFVYLCCGIQFLINVALSSTAFTLITSYFEDE